MRSFDPDVRPLSRGWLARPPRRAALRRLLAVLLLALAGAGCATTRTGPVVAPAAGPLPSPQVPVVLVPGMTGTGLVRPDGSLEWGSGRRVFFPRDRGHGLALPLDGSEPRLRPGRVLREMRLLGVIRYPVYEPLIRTFKARGYVAGSLADPRPGETFLTFPYDWRRDHTGSAAKLLEGLQRLHAVREAEREAARGSEPEPLEVDLICQSSAAHLCRWLVKYGGATLEEAEAALAAGEAVGLPPEVRVRRLVLVGASNAGSLRTLMNLHRGRQYLGVGRYFSPETLFTLPSLYQDLPVPGTFGFLDASGGPVEVDLYDPASWLRYGWSVFAPAAVERLAESPEPELFGTPLERHAFLARQLDRARRFQDLLARDAAPDGTGYLLVQNPYEPTLHRAVLESPGPGLWRTRFPYEEWFADRPYLFALSTTTGDHHATLASQRALSPAEWAALAAEPFTVAGGHFDMITAPATLRWLVATLAPPGTVGPASSDPPVAAAAPP